MRERDTHTHKHTHKALKIRKQISLYVFTHPLHVKLVAKIVPKWKQPAQVRLKAHLIIPRVEQALIVVVALLLLNEAIEQTNVRTTYGNDGDDDDNNDDSGDN